MQNKTVITSFGSWGDIFVAGAAIFEAIENTPNSEHWICGPQKWLEIIDEHYLHAIEGVIIPTSTFNADIYERNSGKLVKIYSNYSLIQFYKSFNTFINLRTESLRHLWPALIAKIPNRVGTAPWPWTYFYTHRAPWIGYAPLIHERERYLQVIEALNNSDLQGKWKQKTGLPPFRSTQTSTLNKYNLKKPYLLINPTASRREKAWSAKNFAEIYSWLKEFGDANVKVIGAPNEIDWLKELSPHDEDIITPNKMHDVIDIISHAKLLITNTSSLQYVAASFNVQSMVLMGRANPIIWGPLGKNDILIKGNHEKQSNMQLEEIEAYKNIKLSEAIDKLIKLLRK